MAAPIASADGETPDTRIDVTEFKRVSGGTVMLRFTLVNDGDKQLDTYSLINNSEGGSVDGIYLVDLAGKKKYEVVRDSDKHCICSRGIQPVPSKSSANYWAKFPAPPDSVDKVGIAFPHFIPLDDTPLAK
jgi:hypothetical protein